MDILGFNNVQSVIDETNAQVVWRPCWWRVFNAVNPSVYSARENPFDPKIVHNFTWLHEWARLAGLPLTFPTEYHPVKSVLAMRCCCVLEDDQESLQRFTAAAFDAYFGEGRNIDDPEVLVSVANSIGLEGSAVVSHTADQVIKDRLRANTDEAISRGAYGSPSMFVNDQLYFGNDQLPLVAQALRVGSAS